MHTKQQYNKITSKQYILSEFEKLWSCYPKRDGRIDALRHFTAEMKKSKDSEALVKQYRQAMTNYKNSRQVQQGDKKYVKNGSTWFYNWKDWETNPDPGRDPEFDEMDKLLKEGK